MLQTLYLAPGFFPPPPQKRVGRRQAVSLDGLLDDGADRRDQRVVAAEPGAVFSFLLLHVLTPAGGGLGRGGQAWDSSVLLWHRDVPQEVSRS